MQGDAGARLQEAMGYMVKAPLSFPDKTLTKREHE